MKRTMMLFVTVLFLSVSLPVQGAVYVESFLNEPHEWHYWTLWEGWEAKFDFDLTQGGGKGHFIDNTGYEWETVDPYQDAAGFQGGAKITGASIDFRFSSQDFLKDRVEITGTLGDGTTGLLAREQFLYGSNMPLSIDLADLGLLNELADGSFSLSVLTPHVRGFWDWNNIILDSVALTVTTQGENNVPLPASLFLLMPGTAVLFGLRRKLFQ